MIHLGGGHEPFLRKEHIICNGHAAPFKWNIHSACKRIQPTLLYIPSFPQSNIVIYGFYFCRVAIWDRSFLICSLLVHTKWKLLYLLIILKPRSRSVLLIKDKGLFYLLKLNRNLVNVLRFNGSNAILIWRNLYADKRNILQPSQLRSRLTISCSSNAILSKRSCSFWANSSAVGAAEIGFLIVFPETGATSPL